MPMKKKFMRMDAFYYPVFSDIDPNQAANRRNFAKFP